MPYEGILMVKRRIVAIPSILSCQRKMRRRHEPLAWTAHPDFAGHRMYFHAAAAATQVSPARMFALFFNHYGDVGSDFAGNRFSREMEIRSRGNVQLHSSRDGF